MSPKQDPCSGPQWNYQWIQVEQTKLSLRVVSIIFKTYLEEATLWGELSKENFPPSRTQKSVKSMRNDINFITSAHPQPDVRNFWHLVMANSRAHLVSRLCGQKKRRAWGQECIGFCSSSTLCRRKWYYLWQKIQLYGLSVPCEQSKNIERLHEYKPSVQSNFSAGKKFVWYHV